MLTKIIPFLLIMLITAGCSGLFGLQEGQGEVIRGSGPVISESREVSGFKAVTIQGVGDVVIDQTGSESLTIRANENLLPYIVTEVRGDTLTIRTLGHVVFADVDDLTYEITVAELEAVELAGAGNVVVNDLDTSSWTAKLPGAGKFDVSGKTDKQSVQLDGAGSYNAENLESREASIRSSGAGMVVVRVSDKLDVTIDGLGSVQYIGDPVVTQTINGMGSVSQR